VAKPPAGRLAVDATVSTTAPVVAWSATVNARGIDPAAAVAGAPHGDVRVDASGRGKGANGTIDLKGLVAVLRSFLARPGPRAGRKQVSYSVVQDG